MIEFLSEKVSIFNYTHFFGFKLHELSYIDLYAGCGGLSLGLTNAGWKGIFAIEKNPDAFSTFKHNLIDNKNHFDWPEWLPIKNHNINYFTKKYANELAALQGKITLVAGGPPCQGFSTAGARNEKDVRNKLVQSYIKFIEIVKPKLIFFENVKGFTYEFKKKNKKGKTYSDEVIENLHKLGYELSCNIINFSEYGVPQARSRFILVGKLGEEVDSFFDSLLLVKNKILDEKGITKKVSVKDAISDLLESNGKMQCPDSKNFYSGLYTEPRSNYQKYMRQDLPAEILIADSHRFVNHTAEIVDQFKLLLKYGVKNKKISGELKEKFNIKKRSISPLDGNHPSPVLTSIPDEHVHYKEPRVLTVREYARIQSFPDWYKIKGKYTTGGYLRKIEVPRYTQLANAIPPLFGEQCGITLKEFVD